ncbi:MAG: sulfide/dihydroorotate dehydrogenase-like FAD/NAD-binding protein [archaeon]
MSYKITRKRELNKDITEMDIDAPLVAKKAEAGQFIILMVDRTGERIPLTVKDANPSKGTVTIVFMKVGKTTKQLGSMNEGDSVFSFVGPLGHPFQDEEYGHVVCIGGGVGIAPIYPIAKALKGKNKVTSILGARSKDLLILEEDMKSVSGEVIVMTDDGSYGRKGLVTDAERELLQKGGVDLIIAIGPVVMMKYCAKVAKEFGVRSIVSLDSIMIDGTGMCGGCRVMVGGKAKFTCTDGPHFDGDQIDFDELMLRKKAYIRQEKESLEMHEGRCRIGLTD